jgi:hypothetical protein
MTSPTSDRLRVNELEKQNQNQSKTITFQQTEIDHLLDRLTRCERQVEVGQGWCIIVSDSHAERQVFKWPSPPNVIPAEQIRDATLRVWTKQGRENPRAIYLAEVPREALKALEDSRDE